MAKKKKADIGIDAESPKSDCKQDVCPWHGFLKVRGRIFRGRVVSDKAPQTVTVTWDYLNYIPKYERYMRKRTKISAHNPACINAKSNDVVRIAECRPISKTKKFVVIEKVQTL